MVLDVAAETRRQKVASARRLLLTTAGQNSRSSARKRPRQVNLLACASVVLGLAAVGNRVLLQFGLDVTPLAVLGVVLGCLGVCHAASPSKAGLPLAALLISVVGLGIGFLPGKPMNRSRGQLAVWGPAAVQPTLLPVAGQPSQPQTAEVGSEWTPASLPARRNGMQVQLIRAEVSSPNASKALGSVPVAARLTLVMEVKNISETHVFRSDKDWLILKHTVRDNFKNRYSQVPPTSGNPFDNVVPESLYPGKSYRTTLTFEAPVETMQELFLELPAECIGGSEPVKIRIPAEMIIYRNLQGKASEENLSARSAG